MCVSRPPLDSFSRTSLLDHSLVTLTPVSAQPCLPMATVICPSALSEAPTSEHTGTLYSQVGGCADHPGSAASPLAQRPSLGPRLQPPWPPCPHLHAMQSNHYTLPQMSFLGAL